jgi:glycosyltransferase involved in cell wall biosynthesis
MHITELVDSLEIGGAERMAADLAQGLQRRGHTVSVVCLRRSGPVAECLRDANIEVVTLEKGEGLSLSALRKLSAYLEHKQVDVVHTHNPLTHHYGTVAGRRMGVPVVVNTFHGPSNLTGFGRTQAIFEASCLLSDRVVACCQAVDAHLRRITFVAKRKLSVIPNGISLEKFTRIPARTQNGKIVFGTVGRLVPVKDHINLLEAFAEVCSQEPDVQLELLGDGPLYSALQQRADGLGIASRVILHRASLDAEKFLARLDVFVLCSRSEGLPLSLLEAMAAALPVVATSVGAVPELVHGARCGWLCPSAQPAALASAMLNSLQCRQRNEWGLRGREYVVEHNSVAAMTLAYEQLFENLLHARASLGSARATPRTVKTP